MLSNRAEKWYAGMIKKAAHLGQLSDMPVYKIGAILVHKKGIIGMGYNKKKTHPLQRELNQYREEGRRDRSYLHAEVDCLTGVRDVPNGSILFIGRLDQTGRTGMSRPCQACMHAIRSKGIKEVVYNTPSGYAIERID